MGPGYGGGGAMSAAVQLCLREGNKWVFDWISRVWGDFVGWEALLDCRVGSLGPSAREEEKAGKLADYLFLSGPTDRDDILKKSITLSWSPRLPRYTLPKPPRPSVSSSAKLLVAAASSW